MVPHIENSCTQIKMDTFGSEFILSEFLHEMDELDLLQTSQLEFKEPKRGREFEISVEPELKKSKFTKPSEA